MNEPRNNINQAFFNIKKGNLREAAACLRKALDDNRDSDFGYRIDAVEDDLQRMLGYMRRGYTDPARDGLYSSLLKRLYTVAADMSLAEKIKGGGMPAEVYARAATFTASHEQIRHELETFVADVALLSLDTTDDRHVREEELYRHHYGYMSRLFDFIIVSPQWKTADADFYEGLILSPTIESGDALLLTSAVTIACICEFDFNKLKTLVGLYVAADNEPLRQRSLVGWLTALHDNGCFDKEKAALVGDVCAVERTVREVTDVQRQMLFCMNAEKDNEKIQRDIMPTLVENNRFYITRDGIKEKEDDPMDDILGRESADRRMEKLEESIHKMIDMQQAGSDIYFGGFSQMKRFPFFYTPSNWFVPFSPKHPDLQRTVKKTGGSRFLDSLMQASPFCDSDKYSLALAMASVIDKIPEQMREMLETEGFASPLDEDIKTDTPAYIRRMYLQDLYRFFRLYPNIKGIESPFGKERFVFTADAAFKQSPLQASLADLCLFFHKHKNADALQAILTAANDSDDKQMMLFRAIYQDVYKHNAFAAVAHYERFLQQEPQKTSAAAALARAYMTTRQYDKALKLYTGLVETDPGNKTYAVNRCVALVKCGLFDDAARTVYRLYFDYPDDINVARVMAWTLMEQGKLEEADKEYDRVLKREKSNADDKLNAGYCKWFMGNIEEAAALFEDFIAAAPATSLATAFAEDSDMLHRHGISDTDLKLMTYITEHTS